MLSEVANRMELYNDPPNWVKGRFECTHALKFHALLSIIERDVKEANRHLNDKFTIETENGGCDKVVLVKSSTKQVCIEMKKDSKRIYVNGPDQGSGFIITTYWNGTLCKLKTDGKTFELWELSQIIIENLFFPIN